MQQFRWLRGGRMQTFCLLTFAILTTLIAGRAGADVLLLVDGRIFHGELIEEADRYIRFRHNGHGIWQTEKISRLDIDTLRIERGDQSDRGGEFDGMDDTDPGSPDDSDPAPSGPVKSGTTVVVIPLHGSVGPNDDLSRTGSFNAEIVEQCLVRAERDNADVVIFDVDSPGGFVLEMESICDRIMARHDDLRMIAFVDEAYSAAAIISLTCRELAVRPNSLFGAATIIRRGENGEISELDAKLASPHYARQRQYMHASGKPYDVVAAMTIMKTRLWWSDARGFTTDPADVQAGGEWDIVDDEQSILTVTADEAVRWRLANHVAADVDMLVERLRLKRPVDVVDYGPLVRRYNDEIDRRLAALGEQFRTYFEQRAILRALLSDLGSGRGSSRTTQRIGTAVARIQSAVNAIEEIARTLENRQVRTLNAGKTIVVVLSQELLALLAEDRQLFRQLRSALRSQRDVQRAIDRFNQSAANWADFLGGDDG